MASEQVYDFEKGRIKFIRGGKYPHCNSILIDDERRTIIDAASREEALVAIGRERKIDVLINSHGHEDHFLYNYLFPDAELWVHAKDAHLFLDHENLLQAAEMDEPAKRFYRGFLLNDCHFTPRVAARLLDDGEMLDFGAVKGEVIHTPGHTPGHCSFYFPAERILVTGDLDLVNAGPYYGDYASSIEETIASLRRLRVLPCDLYLTPHGKGVLDGDPRHIDRYLECIYAREDALIDFLRGGSRTLEEITNQHIIYGSKSTLSGMWDLTISERAMMKKHLERLERRGLVGRQDGYFQLA